jgi:osmotically-inducible protein OsmY
MIRFVSPAIKADGDRDLERRVTAFLAGRNVPALRRLYVHSSQGVVTLRGHVHTFYEKQLGGSVARRVAGVVQLVDDVQVAAAENVVDARSSERATGGRAATLPSFARVVDLDPVFPGVKEGPQRSPVS